MFRLSIRDMVSFYDTRSHKEGKHASSVTGIVGEELSASLLKHYFNNIYGHKASIIGLVPTPGTTKGQRLDKWLLVESNKEDTLYQTEIKNWSAHSIGGQELLFDASEQETLEIAHSIYTRQWDSVNKTLIYPQTRKVLNKMKVPQSLEYFTGQIRPLICFWFPILPNDAIESDGCLSRVLVNNENFEELDIFSVSLYLRRLFKNGFEHVGIDMPILEERLSIIQKLFVSSDL